MTSQRTSHSQIDSFTECERKHYYSYGEFITPVTDNDNMSRGNIFHKILSEFYLAIKLGQEYWDAAGHALTFLESEVDEHNLYDRDAIRNEVVSLLGMYWDHYEHEKLKVVEVEVKHEVKLTDDVDITIVIDLLAEMPGYGLIAIDHKVVYDFYNVDKIDMSFQLPRYMAALSEMGYPIQGIWYNEIRHRSTKDNQADPSLRFRRTPVPITPEKVVTVMREHLMAARRISQLKSGTREEWEQRVIRNPAACQYCQFKDVCNADLNGIDQRIIREAYYKARERR